MDPCCRMPGELQKIWRAVCPAVYGNTLMMIDTSSSKWQERNKQQHRMNNMLTSLESKDGLIYSPKEILNFSENWKSLYQPFPWQHSIPVEEAKFCNSRREHSTKIDSENRHLARRPNHLGDNYYLVTNNFTPNNHSTPNLKIHKNNKQNEGSGNSTLHDSSIEAMSFSTTYPDPETSLSGERYLALDEQCGALEVGAVPSISRDVDANCRHKYICKEIYCDRNRNRRLRKTGIKGVRCIVSFALTDDPVKKRSQIQACSISIMILAIVSISFVLVYFTSNNKYTVPNVPVPTTPSNMTAELMRTTSSTVRFPIIESLTNELASTPRTISTTEGFGDRAISEKNFAISQIILKIQKNLRSYPKFPRRSYPSNDTTLDDFRNQNDNETGDASVEFCNKCQKDVEVCMLNEESGIPVCINATDRHDPTGCGGICAMETEACQLVDKARGVRVCRALSSLHCTAQQWRCHNGLCVARSGRCDGRVDCYDRSDEIHCECDLSKHFRCGHSTSCFPNSKLCDGIIDCWDGRDEVNCTTTCPGSEFTCTSGQCIAQERFCDGLADCADGSDEPRGCDAACGNNELHCSNSRCVSRSLRCDGVDNCGDRTDELLCS